MYYTTIFYTKLQRFLYKLWYRQTVVRIMFISLYCAVRLVLASAVRAKRKDAGEASFFGDQLIAATGSAITLIAATLLNEL